ncbi:MAG: tetratricopeptide repeat protein, partial [Gammaproteobacteria bacterium]|nr:tetratricopeptide repeat protein [Gammaproteobacteria bacterium]
MNAFMMLFKSFILSIIVLALASCGGADERKLKYLEKGKVYLEKNDLDKAKVEFKNVVQIDPKFAEAYYYFGRLEERKKELGKAISYYRKAVELDINYVAAKVRLAKMYLVVNTPEYNAKSNE